MTRHVIIGGGIAGTTAAETIRKLDQKAEITIISQEQHACYSRVLLPHYIKESINREKVFLKKESWYQDQNIEWMRGVEVTKIDPKNNFVLTSEGRELPFDKLLITTGGSVRLLSEDLRGTSYFRTLDDADHIKQLIGELKTSKSPQALVYGGGFIAFEYINIFKHFNIPFKVIMRSPGFWSKSISPDSSAILENLCKQAGAEVITDQEITSLKGKSELEGVTLSSENALEGSMLGIGIGIIPDLSLINEAGIKTGKGVLANEYLETNIKNIYTAGDIAEFKDVITGHTYLAGNWMNALMQARAVAASMTGERTKFELVTSYATNILGTQVVSCGVTDRSYADKVEQRSLSKTAASELFFKGAALIGAVLIGDTKERAAITKAIKEKSSY